MNERRFQAFQTAIDDRFLEEAALPPRKRPAYRALISVAACLGLLVVAVSVWRPWQQTGPSAQLANPVQESSAQALTALGYRMSVPAGATQVHYTAVELSADHAVPMAQVTYQEDGTRYTCRALQTAQSEDISGQHQSWSSDFSWRQGDIELRLCSNEQTSWVGWYVPAEGTQWCLSAQSDGQALLNDAMRLARDLGFDLSTAPEDAEDVSLRVLNLNGLTVAETSFLCDGVRYAYRTAATPELVLTDISGQEIVYAEESSVMVSYCEGQLSLTEGAAGKLLWLDIVPGLVYSLSTEGGASAGTMTALADQLFISVQGDAG